MGEGEGGMIWENGIETCEISYVKQIASPGLMHDTGCSGLVHWDDPDGWYGEGGGFRMGKMCTLVMDSCWWCMPKPIQYCQVKNKKIKPEQPGRPRNISISLNNLTNEVTPWWTKRKKSLGFHLSLHGMYHMSCYTDKKKCGGGRQRSQYLGGVNSGEYSNHNEAEWITYLILKQSFIKYWK